MRELIDSGIEWIGDIPSNWPIRKIGQMYYERRTKVNDIDYPPLSVTMKGILPQIEGVAKTDAHDSRKLVLQGDFAINSRSDRRGACGIADRDGSVSLINIVLQPREGMNPSYLNWLFHTSMFADEFYRNGQGIVDDMWTTKWDDMKRIYIPFPNLEEQSRIASYLDSHIASIDDSIARYKTLSDKLDEYRNTIISKAVSKGEYIPLKYIVNYNQESLSESTDKDFVFDYVDIGSVSYKKGIEKTERMKFENSPSRARRIVQSGDVIVSTVRTYLKAVAQIHEFSTPIIVSTGFIVLTAKAKVSKEFLGYALKNEDFVWQVKQNSYGISYPAINSSAMVNLKIQVPSEKEQLKIVEFLDKQCADIDKAKDKIDTIVKKLEEYKKSLIYNAVTGKIEC